VRDNLLNPSLWQLRAQSIKLSIRWAHVHIFCVCHLLITQNMFSHGRTYWDVLWCKP
jgi:hypothetical protein